MSGNISSTDFEHYYTNLFPFKPVFQWLNHQSEINNITNDIVNRELAMSFKSGAYKRYVSVNSLSNFKETIISYNPVRFEIGAIYDKPPRDREILLKNELNPLYKELIFDIDMDDYDSFRTCCKGAAVCDKCWKFITIAMKIINIALENDFGFKNYIWIFSGRRGAHCWISDQRAMQLNYLERKNILDYLNVIKDRSLSKRLNLRRPYHPHLLRSLNLLKPIFTDFILLEQDPWRDDANAFETLLTNLFDRQHMESLKTFWTKNPNRSSLDKWKDIDQIAQSNFINSTNNSNSKNQNLRKKEFMNKLQECKEDIIMLTLYPKLDVEVTKQVNHLLKSPFCIHPATGKICVPINNDFNPDMAPMLSKIQFEFESLNGSNNKTSLEPFILYFQDYVDKLNENLKMLEINNKPDLIKNEKKRSIDQIN